MRLWLGIVFQDLYFCQCRNGLFIFSPFLCENTVRACTAPRNRDENQEKRIIHFPFFSFLLHISLSLSLPLCLNWVLLRALYLLKSPHSSSFLFHSSHHKIFIRRLNLRFETWMRFSFLYERKGGIFSILIPVHSTPLFNRYVKHFSNVWQGTLTKNLENP